MELRKCQDCQDSRRKYLGTKEIEKTKAVKSFSVSSIQGDFLYESPVRSNIKMLSNNSHASRRRSRSPLIHSDSTKVHRRSRSPQPHQHHQPHRHRPSSRSHARKAPLPLGATPLHRHDFETYKPMFSLYLDIQKQLVLEDLEEDEVKGRWKSFMSKW